MQDITQEQPAAPEVVDRSAFQAELDALRAREKDHMRQGDAIAAARRRLPMVEVDGTTPLIGEHGAVTLLDAFEGRRQLIAYYFMWFLGRPAAEQCEGCTPLHRADPRVVLRPRARRHLCDDLPGPPRRVRPVSRVHGLGDAVVFGASGLARNPAGRTPGEHDAHRLLPATRIRRLRDILDDAAWRRGDGQQLPVLDLTVYGRQEAWEDSPPGWPQLDAGADPWRIDGRPTPQWARLKAGHSDDLRTA